MHDLMDSSLYDALFGDFFYFLTPGPLPSDPALRRGSPGVVALPPREVFF